jgi:hypothetical protein
MAVTWQSEQERLGCQCLRSDAWRCNNERIAVGTGDQRRVSCPCECHRYLHAKGVGLYDQERA